MSQDLKSCCAALYESDFARLLLGDSFHPGGLRLTQRLGELLALRPGMRVLDVASGKGESAMFVARHFGCAVTGVDYGSANVNEAAVRATAAGLSDLITFHEGDAEQLDFIDASFDVVICECAFCTFPDKASAAREFSRVLRDGGRIGLSDLTRSAPLPPALEGLLAWIACIADARPVSEYVSCLEAAGIAELHVEPHEEALAEMVREIQGKLLGAELISKLKKLDLEGVDFDQARALARAAGEAVREKTLGYAIVTGVKKPAQGRGGRPRGEERVQVPPPQAPLCRRVPQK